MRKGKTELKEKKRRERKREAVILLKGEYGRESQRQRGAAKEFELFNFLVGLQNFLHEIQLHRPPKTAKLGIVQAR